MLLSKIKITPNPSHFPNICDAACQNQALFARLRSAVELSLQAYPQKVENEFPTESVS